jgi:predicted aconitase with swiveling domain/8-oxo-dGTP pyrophosphatase MutT (NUDIX family)
MPLRGGVDGDDLLILKGRGISPGRGEGNLVLLPSAFSFLGGVDASSGRLSVASGREGANIKGSVFAFPRGKGSTVGSYTILDLKRNGNQPSAIINAAAEPIVATGAVMARVPMVDRIDLSLLRDGDRVIVDGTEGTLDLPDVEERNVVTSVMRCGGKVLMLKRSQKVSTNKGKWAAISGYIESGEDPLKAARREIGEEIGRLDPELIKEGGLHIIRGDRVIWNIHTFLFSTPDENVTLDWEHTEYRWLLPAEIEGLPDRVPGLAQVVTDLLQ